MSENNMVLRSALAGLVESSARWQRMASAQREEVSDLLAAADLRRVADSDPQLAAAISRHADSLVEAKAVAEAWQEKLAAAAQQWEEKLAELDDIHGEH